jgi:hypothetical protein
MLASMMKQAAIGAEIFAPHAARMIAEPCSRNWQELWRILLTNPTAR